MSAVPTRLGGGEEDTVENTATSRTPLTAAYVSTLTIFAIYALALSLPNAAANILPLQETEVTISAVCVFFLVNLPVNLLAYSALMSVLCRVWSRRIGNLPRNESIFLGNILLVVLLITVLGVAIDFLFLYSYETKYIFQYDFMKWLVAAATVGLSVYALSLFFLRMDIVLGAIPALAMVCLNLASWWITSETSGAGWILCLIGPSLFAAGLSLIPLRYLVMWHRKAFADEPTDVV